MVVWGEALARAQRKMPLRGLGDGAAERQADVQARPRARALPPALDMENLVRSHAAAAHHLTQQDLASLKER